MTALLQRADGHYFCESGDWLPFRTTARKYSTGIEALTEAMNLKVTEVCIVFVTESGGQHSDVRVPLFTKQQSEVN